MSIYFFAHKVTLFCNLLKRNEEIYLPNVEKTDAREGIAIGTRRYCNRHTKVLQ